MVTKGNGIGIEGNLTILEQAQKLAAIGMKLSLSQQLAHMGLAAALREHAEPMRLREAHLRKFQYIKTGEHTYDRHQLDHKRYDCETLRELRHVNGVGKRARRFINMVRILAPWAHGPRYVGFNIGLDENNKPIFTDYRLFRDAPSRGSKLRRCDGEMRNMTDEQWLFVFNRMRESYQAGML